jgi:glycosyltransferase involved in cell wall biosynthesis
MGLDAELVLVGDGPYRAQMESELKSTRARFLGFKHGPELSRLYASSDLFLFPSITDTLGQVVMESQASGLPVIVTDQGGPKEVVIDGATGFVLPHDKPDLWVARIVSLAVDEPLRRRMGAAAHQHMQGFSLAHSFDHFWEVHEHARREWLVEQQTREIGARSPRAAEETQHGGSAPIAAISRELMQKEPA